MTQRVPIVCDTCLQGIVFRVGTGTEQSISYVDYLYKCNEITMRLAVLLLIEIYLIEY